MHLVCPHCQSINRLNPERLSDAPNCGRCHRALLTAQPLELDEAGLQRHLQHEQLPLLLDCWAPWCGPCRNFAPVFSAAARAWEGKVRFAKLNTEAQPQAAQALQIRSIPTLILFQSGHEKTRLSGALSAPQLQQWLQHALAGLA